MPLRKYINRIEKFDQLVREERTGTPQEFAYKLHISKRAFHELKTELIDDFSFPIAYCHKRKTYYYTKSGQFKGIFFEKDN